VAGPRRRYARLAKREEEGLRARFGDAYAAYARATPRLVPRLWN
jgi:Cu+-exporting ATPase